MTKIFLITRPNHEIRVSYLYEFSRDIVKMVQGMKDIHIIDLEDVKANRNEVEKVMKKMKPGLIFFNGHGNKSQVMGHKDEIVLDEHNINLAENSIIYALSCNSLEKLGRIAIERGTRAYIGYRAKFMIVRDPSRIGNPSKDKNALPFKKACSKLIDSLVFGKTVCASVEEAKMEYTRAIKYYGTSEDDFGDVPLIRFALTWDLEFLDFCGDGDACF